MQLTQLTDAQLTARLDYFCEIYLASTEMDYDFKELESTLDDHYYEAHARGLM